MKFYLIIAIALTMMVFTSCDEDAVTAQGTLSVSFAGLTDLGATEVYEGWIIVGGSPVSTGTFTVDADGNLSRSSFTVEEAALESATAFVLSIEPASDPDPAPSELKILQGTFNGSNAPLDMSIIADFSSISAKYILATPTSAATDDELSGVWFLDNSSGSAVAGLDLPDLSGVAGWTYEGWVVFPGAPGPITTGTFDDPTTMDSNGGGPYKGSDAGAPGYPGDDFVMGSNSGITFPSDLSGGKVVISLEPVPDNSAAPFSLKPIFGDVPAAAVDHTVYDAPSNLVTGTASR